MYVTRIIVIFIVVMLLLVLYQMPLVRSLDSRLRRRARAVQRGFIRQPLEMNVLSKSL